MVQKSLNIDSKHVRNKVLKHCDFHMGARSISQRSGTLTTHTSNYKNHVIIDNTVFKQNIYIFDNVDSSWLSSVSIESMGEILLL